uniref:Small ribosomal subunit protein uS11c n=3 Tax=Araceae TaxID=4454 RepID=A0A481YLV2_9ARAE|nr:ribosomal protein S11 [Epipremnum aureum]YP_009582462.1 ribosomal protein S11 [Zantedeschia hybrid cultivar]YP_010976968.1 ribosomal protein S11 [Zantedeschia elliottiana]QJF46708.1 ribosomal protein S11 [Zantedeschia rehmannii]ALB38616.1 ribosomal protein S11 [Epipremnum aureum]QBK84084.1 ribosomal protein S11 [Zantedeschia hybrid cultivar]WNZ34200.1 ribosomal protein S11 [Zantedeschia elliottiana]
MINPILHLRRYRYRYRRRIRSHKKRGGRIIQKGIIRVQASFNNTIVTVTDMQGQVVSWSCAGIFGFKGPKKGTPAAAQAATEDAIRIAADQGMQRAEVMIKGTGPGRDAALQTICKSGIRFRSIRDVTPMPHNGCRPPNKRRI